jgi:hypothetical protein
VRPRSALLVLAVLAAGAARAGAPAAPVPFASTRALRAGLGASGRAEAALRLIRNDPLGGRPTVQRGRLILERPRLARLELDDGERLTLREDGGDWLQPALRQLVRAGARSAGGALAWWGVLLDPRDTGIRERRTGAREYTLTQAGAPGAPTQRVELGADGLPRRLTVEIAPGERVEYRLSRWRFTRARGRADFRLEAPAGFEVVEMP